MADITKRPERVKLPPAEERYGFMLEMFEVGDGPKVPSWKTNPRRHAIWLHCLKAGGWRWRCCCGEGRTQDDLDVALLVEARTHFDQAWATAAVPIGHAICLWNDRVAGSPPPSIADLEQLVRELRREEADVTPIRTVRAEVEPVHLCGLCGKTFRIADDDPHWSTGRGPLCPTEKNP